MRTRTDLQPPTMPHQGQRLKRALTAKGTTQSWLADRLGVSRQLVSKWITRRNWESRTVIRVAAALGLPPAYFFEAGTKKGTAGATDRPQINNQGAPMMAQPRGAVNRRRKTS